MWHMGTWDDPLVTRGGDTRSGRSVVPYTVHVARPAPARPLPAGTIRVTIHMHGSHQGPSAAHRTLHYNVTSG